MAYIMVKANWFWQMVMNIKVSSKMAIQMAKVQSKIMAINIKVTSKMAYIMVKAYSLGLMVINMKESSIIAI
jgi:hypothetical protein